MKITTLIAAAALATASTAAIADQANVTTDAGEIVMVEKAQGFEALAPFLFTGVMFIVASSTGS